MALERINPHIRYARGHEYFREQRAWSICYDARLFYLACGRGYIELEDGSRDISEGALIYLSPRTKYRFGFEDSRAVRIKVINFDLVDDFSNIKGSLGTAVEDSYDSSRSPIYTIPEEFSRPIILVGSAIVESNLSEIVEAFLVKNDYYRELCSAKLKLILFDMLVSAGEGSRDADAAASVERYVKANYQNHELDNAEVARVFNYHPYHINRLIKARTGKTLHAYLLDFRLHIAKNYLSTSSLSVTEIAELCGFSSYNYFIRCFRERVGIPPLRYRKEKRSSGI